MTTFPAWVDMIPVFAAIVTATSIGLKIGRLLQKLDYIIDDVKQIKLDCIVYLHPELV